MPREGRGTAGDPRFYAGSGPHALSAVATAAGGVAEAAERTLYGVAPLQTAGPGEVSFLDNRRYVEALERTRAGAVLVHPELAPRVPAGTASIVTAEPYQGWARVAALFHPPAPLKPGIHPSAVVGEGARVDPTAEIGPLVVIGARAEIGPRCRIAPGAVIGEGVAIGPDGRIGALASVSHAILGPRVTLYPGARVGQDGFGFAVADDGFRSVPQLGRVILEHDVEVGANTTIDRGSVQDTVIGAGTRLDNLVQIGHNVRIGRLCVVVSQAGISGSTIVEDFVMIGGQAGLVGHLRIGRKARLGAQAGVMADVAPGAEVVGSPAEPVRTFFRQIAVLRRLARGERQPGRQSGRETG
ncbi:MAG TPA: UDP-3-O-(3-hydroxymyristoyl)glucosamine N-acyltransferase [Acetobacteraceae bacterium]|nr:UDP-3-O-(3-hydroxymyristoyl)glucosamine N-acyltransferase [Acetobacteraceae bacterium]